MRESLQEMFNGIEAATLVSRDRCEAGDYEAAVRSLGALLSYGSKLHARVRLLVEMAQDAAIEARARAEVDRAVAMGPAPMNGEVELPFPTRKATRGGKGRKGGGTSS